MVNYERFDKIQMIEFNAGKMEWRDWITSSESYIKVSSRIHHAFDKDEKAYFIGVLFGAKSNGFNPNDPKNIKARNWKGELIKIDAEPENHTKKGRGRMLIAARNRKKTIYHVDEGVVCYGCGQVIYEYKYGVTEEGNMPFCLECCNNA